MPINTVLDRGTRLLRMAGSKLTSAVMPLQCVFCGIRREEGDSVICSACFADLPWIEHSCKRCAQPLQTSLPEGVYCAACQLQPPPFTSTMAPLLYAFPIDAAIKALKFRRKLFYVPAFKSLLARSSNELPQDIDALLPVPLHWRRHAVRGFNQAAELCKKLPGRSELPLITTVVRTRSTPYQSGLAARQRRRNLRSAFVVHGKISARHVLIVDDVITTGETCRQLAKAVLRGGAEKVSVLAIARAANG